MPQEKHLRGVGEKEQRIYENIKESAQNEGRYRKRAEEVAARTVMRWTRYNEFLSGFYFVTVRLDVVLLAARTYG